MDSVDSSPNYMKARSRFDPKKENSPGGSESDEIMSVSCSTCGSAVMGAYAPKLSNSGIKHRSSNKKTPKNFATVRRRPKPRLIQSPVPLSDDDDDDEASPHYLKATTSSECKKSRSSESRLHESDGSTSRSSQPKLALSRKSSFRNVRILMKRASFKPKRSLLRDIDAGVDRATYSSTLKDSKFPAPLEIQLHPTREEQSDETSAVKVCRYHHCSLHGGCHASGESAPPLKPFLYKRKQSLRKQKGVAPKPETTRGVKLPSDRNKNLHKRVISDEVESVSQDRFSVSSNEKGKNPPVFGDGFSDVQEAYLVELAFGETSFPERSYRDSLDILRKYSSSSEGRASSRCSCHNTQESMATSEGSLEWKNDKDASDVVVDTSICIDDVAVSCKDGPDTPLISDDKTNKGNAFSSASSTNNYSEEDTQSSPPVEEDSKAASSETSTPTHNGNGGELHFSKPRHMSMWNLIHQHMSSNVTAESTHKGSADEASDSETQEIELRKMLAVKLVREAIEKILLPEVQDQASDDQSVTSETTPRAELAHGEKGNVSSDPKEEAVVAEVVKKSEKKAPKHWSNLKKWILLQRFIRELEKVRKFNPKKPRLLPLNPDPEAEKVSLRPQTVEERKSAEEWMLDHALRQAVSQLAPTQKKKVALLVKAFETVVPPQQQHSHAQSRIPSFRTVSVFHSANAGLTRDRDLKSSDENEKLEDPVQEENVDDDGLVVQVMGDDTKAEAVQQDDCTEGEAKDRKKHIKMWHMIYQHVVSNIAEKVGGHLLDGGEDEEQEEGDINDGASSNLRGGLTKSDAVKLVKQAVDEILVPEAQDDASDTQSVQDEDLGVESKPKSRNWGKLKKLLLLKRSIKALEKARPQPGRVLLPDPEPEKVDLRQQMMNERNKAEQWMLDYAVQHIVTTLTPARKRRVAMLVEAFEAVVPLPQA